MSSEITREVRLEVACDLEDLAGADGLRPHDVVAGPPQGWARWFGDRKRLIPLRRRRPGCARSDVTSWCQQPHSPT
ncbi:hypothetical protein ACW14X_27980 [Nocardioides sp. YJ-D4]